MVPYVIIVAGGKGTRMGSNIPKQFLVIAGKPILLYTIEKFKKAIPSIQIIIVLPKEFISYWQAQLKRYTYPAHTVIEGGDYRYESVKNGLSIVPDDAIVGIHDAVRPLVSESLIQLCFEKCNTYEAVIPGIKPIDSIRRMEGENSFPVNRDHFRSIQTPQCFQSSCIKKAYSIVPYTEDLTDDAIVAEKNGIHIHLIEGERNNIKITTPEDLRYFEYYTKNIL